MAVRIARVGREKSLATLAGRIFEIEGANKALDLKRAEAALLRANPRLADRDGFEAGAVVAVPADTGLKLTDRVEFAAREPDDELGETTRRLELGAKTISERFARAEKRADKEIALLDDKDFRTSLRGASKGSPQLANKLKKEIEARKVADRAEAEAFGTALQDALRQVENLSDLLKASTNTKD